MSTTTNLFSGWLGFGTALAGNALSEPADGAYARRPVLLGPLSAGRAQDVIAGTIGPASSPWSPILFAGLFDALSGGNLLATWPLAKPITLGAGQTWTSQGVFTLTLDGEAGASPLASRSWVAGTRVGTVGNGCVVTAAQNLQLSGGQLSIAGGGISLTSVGSLPSTAPISGSGQLWNNGGVICVA